jgi:hypothetical protein
MTLEASDNSLMKLRFRGFYVIIVIYRHTSTTAEGIEGAKLRFLRMEEGCEDDLWSY